MLVHLYQQENEFIYAPGILVPSRLSSQLEQSLAQALQRFHFQLEI